MAETETRKGGGMTAGNERGFPPLTTSRPALLTDNGGDENFRGLVGNLIDFAAQLQTIREALARQMGVTPPQYNILMTLAHHRAALSIGDMANLLRVSVPFIVTETRRLGVSGFLKKRPDLEDRRRVYLELTGKGRAAIVRIAPLQRRVNDALFGSLSARGFASLAKLTDGLLASCDAALAEAESERPNSPQRGRRSGRA
jgi:MarR family transcriptional regulator, organic hydroperoxide resistance regulator